MDSSEAILRRALDRERLARKEAEAILERRSLELYEANRRLLAAREELERRVERRTHELAEAKAAAEASNRAKSEFLANMSHEVRTPMASVLGYADLLLTPGLDHSERDQALQAIRRNGEHLMQIIDDILDLTKIEAGKMDLELMLFEPWTIVIEVLSLLGVRAREREILIEATPVGRIPHAIVSDPTRLRQILLNLVSNAIKFTPSGRHVFIRLSSDIDENDSPVGLTFAVEDEGIGMTEEEKSLLFRPFQQADNSTTRKYGGSGLGLTISKRLAESMGGEILVRSDPGKGSCFTLRLPISQAPGGFRWDDPEQISQAVIRLDTMPINTSRRAGKLLLAEDSADIQRLLVYHLTGAGFEVEVADNGRIAVEKARAQPFDLILMDMQMPELDGYGATSSLREWGYQGPIIALTAHAMSTDRDRCTRAGCSDYLTKPVSMKLLLETIDRHLLARSESEAASAPPGDLLDATLKRDYVASLAVRQASARAALDNGDLVTLRNLVHQTRGVGAMYGFPELTEIAGLLEDAIREGQDASLIGALLDEFDDACKRAESIDTAEQRNSNTPAQNQEMSSDS